MHSTEILQRFPNEKDCVAHLEKIRWGGIVKCPYCDSTHSVRRDPRWYCYTCHTSFSVMVGTVFHHTHIPLQKWFLAIALTLNQSGEVSGMQLSRYLGVNKNTGWRMASRIRAAMLDYSQLRMIVRIIDG